MGYLVPLPSDFLEREYYVDQVTVAVTVAVWENLVHVEDLRLVHLSPEMQQEAGQPQEPQEPLVEFWARTICVAHHRQSRNLTQEC